MTQSLSGTQLNSTEAVAGDNPPSSKKPKVGDEEYKTNKELEDWEESQALLVALSECSLRWPSEPSWRTKQELQEQRHRLHLISGGSDVQRLTRW